jgi:hypothetical protein
MGGVIATSQNDFGFLSLLPSNHGEKTLSWRKLLSSPNFTDRQIFLKS